MSLKATVEAICVMDKVTRFPTRSLTLAEVSLQGFVGDVHSGFIRKADARDRGIPRGTEVRNWRQWSAVSFEELKEIAANMGIENIDPWMLAANLTLSGIPKLTALPRGTQIVFEGGTILSVECENAPCVGPGKQIAAVHKSKTPQEFVKAAMHKRGIVGVVYHPGIIRLGESAKIIDPA